VIVLDTNVVSELIRPKPDQHVIAWVDGHDTAELFITAVTAAKLRARVELLPAGKRRTKLAAEIDARLDEDFAGAVIPFEAATAIHYAEIVASCRAEGNPMSTADTQIAAMCRQHDAALATGNTNNFRHAGLGLIDPWTSA